MTFHEWAFKSKHIPGSLNIHSEESAAALINPSDEIVVYCVNKQCIASITAYHILESKGFTTTLNLLIINPYYSTTFCF
jgi:rhodanese-related sulfurtransferase